MLGMMTARKLVLIGALLIGGGAASGCNWLGTLPLNGSLGDNGTTSVTLSVFTNQVDVTLHNVESNYILDLGGQCGWHGSISAYCMASTVAKVTSSTTVINAVADCGFQSGVGTFCSYGDLFNSAGYFAFYGQGHLRNCLGFHATFGGSFVEPYNPAPYGGYEEPGGSWYTIWPFQPFGYNGDGAGVCNP